MILLIFNGVTGIELSWTKLGIAGPDVAPARREAAAAFDASGNRLIVYGGRVDSKSTVFDDTWSLSLPTGDEDAVWSPLAESGPPPPRRFSCVSGSTATHFYVAVGEGVTDAGDRVFYDDVWRLDFATDSWEEVVTSGARPEARYGSGGGIAAGGAALFVTHGFASDRYQNSFRLDLDTMVWVDVTPSSLVDSSVSAPTGPNKRCLHGATVLDGGRIALFGGCGSGGFGPCPAQDAWLLSASNTNGDAATNFWSQSTSVCAGPRLYSSMAPLPDGDTVVLYGGTGGASGSPAPGEVSLWNTETDEWVRVQPGGEQPEPQQGASLVSAGHSLLAFGGQSSDGVTSDVWVLGGDSVGTLETLDCPVAPPFRELHATCMLLSWGICLPLGITIARFMRNTKPLWFKLHRGLQYTGVVLQLLGFVFAMLMVGAGKFAALPHALFGVVAFLIGFQQPLNAYFRPEPPHEKTPKRVFWERWHKYGGRLGAFLGLINPFWGIAYLTGTAPPLFVIYSVWVGGLVGFWLAMTFSGHPGPENPSVIARKLRLCGKDLYATLPSTSDGGSAPPATSTAS